MTFAQFEEFFRAFDEQELLKFRFAYHGGKAFVAEYCIKFSGRETDEDFKKRLNVTYNPGYASGALDEVKNSLYRKVKDISRVGGPRNYQNAVRGLNNGVDLLGSDMNHFMGVKALKELLIAAEFGVYVDKPPLRGDTLADNIESPYIYLYKREDILAYEYDEGHNSNEFKVLLVRDYENKYDQALGLSSLICERFKLFKLLEINGEPRVSVTMIDKPDYGVQAGALDVLKGQEMQFGEEILLDPGITKIPFVLEQIPKSFMIDIADAQIALMNLVSSDIWYLLRSNFPFYIEPWDPKSEAGFIKKVDSKEAPKENERALKVGATSGRRYPMGTNQPAFISPPTDPVQASMAKQEQIKREIREMVQLSLSSLVASADSKSSDKEKLQDGLAYLAIVLQHAENKIAEYWAMYEGVSPAIVQYPMCYELDDPADVRELIKLMVDLATKVTSKKLKRELLKNTVYRLLSAKLSPRDLDAINKEIESNDVVFADWQEVARDLENGLVDNETASLARGYPAGVVEKAKDDHLDRLLRIQNAQTPAPLTRGLSNDPGSRGMQDQNADPKSGRLEKAETRDTTRDANPTDKTRGPGRIKDSNV